MENRSMESVRPIPKPIPIALEVPLTDKQRELLQKKKRGMKDIVEIQNIYGKFDEKNNKLPREVVRYYRRRNEHGLSTILSHPYYDEIMAWTLDTEAIQIKKIQDQETYVWVGDNATFWFMMSDIGSSKVLWIDLEANEWDGFTGVTCLIQISTSTNNYVVDCLAIPQEIHDKLKHALEDPRILKVMHGSSNDLRWLQRDFGIFLWPLIDTQLLEDGVSGNNQVSFALLVDKYLGITISQDEKVLGHFSDYRRRPLHENLIRYAVRDTYLLKKVWEEIVATPGIGLTDANGVILQCKNHVTDSLYGGITFPHSTIPEFTKDQRSLHEKLTEARKMICRKLNLPAQRVATDQALINSVRNNKAPFNVHPELRLILNEGWKTGSFVVLSKASSNTVSCMKCGSKDHLAKNCTAFSEGSKSTIRKEFYRNNPDAERREKERIKEKRRIKRQATGETKAWFQNKRENR